MIMDELSDGLRRLVKGRVAVHAYADMLKGSVNHFRHSVNRDLALKVKKCFIKH